MLGNLFTAGAVMALLGGAIGGWFATSKVKDGMLLSTITILVGAMCAAGIVDYLNLIDRPWLSLGVGAVTGVLAPRILSVVDAMLPGFLPGIIERVSGNFLGKKGD